MLPSLNLQIAERLDEVATLLEQQDASPFRVAAYRHAADTISGLDEDLGDILEKRGVEGLVALPGIGDSIAAAVREMLRTGGVAFHRAVLQHRPRPRTRPHP